MTKWHSPVHGRIVVGNLLAQSRWSILAAACLALGSIAPQGAAFARGEATKPQAVNEDSVLVATREASPADASSIESAAAPADDDMLEPVAQTSDYRPELATSEEDHTPQQFGAGLTKIAQKGIEAAPAKAIRRAPVVQEEEVKREPVKFRGITVGESTKKELVESWGKPAESVETNEGYVLAYDVDPFQIVEVLVGSGEVVSAIKIALATSLDPGHLAEQLSLDKLRPVTVSDDRGEVLGLAFPERGVLFMYNELDAGEVADDGQAELSVSHVVLQHLDAMAFVMRVENQLHGPYTQNIADLQTALEVDPKCAHAYCLLAKIYLATGQADLADAAASKACEIDPSNASFQLCRGQTQEMLGEYDNSVLTVRAVLDRDDTPQIDRAQALHQMARLASLGDVEIASKAISFDERAIDIADRLATSESAKERRAAKQLLVEAHMSIAEEVARQSFNDKVKNLSLWIGRASGIAEEYITKDGGSVELRLFVAQRSLAALASFRPTLDPSPWIKEAEESAKELLAQSEDDLWQAHVKWELGVAQFNALRVEHVRRETKSALAYGQQSVDNLAAGAVPRQAVHSSQQLVGQLYFQMGAVFAVHQLDHMKAAQWYEKAEPLLNCARPVSELYAPRREGEMLVSIGVTYWQLGEQARALELTQSGVNLVEMAVNDGILAKSTLAVPYGNLATMYQKVGENKNAAKYAQLAKTVATPTSGGETPQMGRNTIGGQDASVPSSASRPRATSLR